MYNIMQYVFCWLECHQVYYIDKQVGHLLYPFLKTMNITYRSKLCYSNSYRSNNDNKSPRSISSGVFCSFLVYRLPSSWQVAVTLLRHTKNLHFEGFSGAPPSTILQVSKCAVYLSMLYFIRHIMRKIWNAISKYTYTNIHIYIRKNFYASVRWMQVYIRPTADVHSAQNINILPINTQCNLGFIFDKCTIIAKAIFCCI